MQNFDDSPNISKVFMKTKKNRKLQQTFVFFNPTHWVYLTLVGVISALVIGVFDFLLMTISRGKLFYSRKMKIDILRFSLDFKLHIMDSFMYLLHSPCCKHWGIYFMRCRGLRNTRVMMHSSRSKYIQISLLSGCYGKIYWPVVSSMRSSHYR